MKTKHPRARKDGARDVTPTGRSVIRDLFSEQEAIELEIRSTLLRGLERWLQKSDMTQVEAAKLLGVTQARISDLKRGKVSQFNVDSLVRLAARAGLHPTVRLSAAWMRETDRRTAELDSGTVQTVPWDAVRARLRR